MNIIKAFTSNIYLFFLTVTPALQTLLAAEGYLRWPGPHLAIEKRGPLHPPFCLFQPQQPKVATSQNVVGFKHVSRAQSVSMIVRGLVRSTEGWRGEDSPMVPRVSAMRSPGCSPSHRAPPWSIAHLAGPWAWGWTASCTFSNKLCPPSLFPEMTCFGCFPSMFPLRGVRGTVRGCAMTV